MQPPGKIKKPPDFAALLRNPRHRHRIGIAYRGSLWRWFACSMCERMFWKNTTRDQYLIVTHQRKAYCSKPCQLEGYRLANLARQRRYKKRRLAGLVDHRGARARNGRRGGRKGRRVRRRRGSFMVEKP